MIYFSELKGRRVCTEDGVEVGRLDDIIFLASENPLITKIVVASRQSTPHIISTDYLKKLNGTFVLKKDYTVSDLQENELHILKNLLDKQIIDLVGSKIVRVNDVAIQEKGGFYISGVDIGILGIFRWLKLEQLILKLLVFFNIKVTPRLLSWADIQPLELARGKVILKKREEKLEKLRAEDLAAYLEQTNIVNARKILSMVSEDFAAHVIGNLNMSYQNRIFRHFTSEKAAKVVSVIDPDEAVDILLTLPSRKKDDIIKLIPEEKRKKILYLLSLSKTSIGDLITTEYLTASPNDTVQQVLDTMRKLTSDFSVMDYVYILNSEKQLVGVVNLHELILQPPDTSLYRFMVQNVIVLHLTTPEEIAIKKVLKYKIQSLPVIDADKHMLGIVTFDDIAEFILHKLQ